MTALEHAAKVVEQARAALLRELASPTEWIGGEYGCDEREAQRLVNTLSGSRFRRTQFRKAADHIEPKDAP